ncbi:DinB family protein [Streptomyces sp. NPDC047017]|uniref:DinB family protein n=1 Tax=Streptomyces sp. NPDC047017 TaxID=3155024 RepID=UPI0033F1FE22
MIDSAPRGDLRPPGLNADEKTTLVAFLGYLRNAVAAKATGAAEDALRTPGVTSGTSVLRLVKHLTAVEHNWFVWAYGGASAPLHDDDVPLADDETAEALLAAYAEAIEESDAVIDACDDLDRPGARSLRETPPPSLRWILVHMIEETARHAGHADILREQIDGSVGR